jgi:hypothetical protein
MVKLPLQIACEQFKTTRVARINPNGLDPDTGHYSVPGAYVNAGTFSEAVKIISEHFSSDGILHREKILFDSEIEKIIDELEKHFQQEKQ